ncbi:15.4 kDa class V heat shock protein [Gracilariopsis chorda]|uniref:15.4 kDa class V heat shock protein n=2 Tax=Gracilariopsis TaxID=2781 RepID=A0A2V3J340_9FLOR|nr:heat shock protein [Gracilariopsis lemaneiformis]PXF48861.1 15.4 kDa class V heat shock protein [Gracilariopsis chorda]|eukprot:PXF48861.1 15.4 kDa class V heat shock protein [Gracilariopsis chorda]
MALSLNVHDPFFPLSSFDRDMHSFLRLADRLGTVHSNRDRTNYQVPNYEYNRDKDNFHLQVELPGVAKEHIEVEMNSGNLTITARRFRSSPAQPVSQEPDQSTENTGENDANKTRSLKPSHVYKMQVKIGNNVDEEGIKAEYNHGVLELIIPQRKMTTRKISITDL